MAEKMKKGFQKMSRRQLLAIASMLTGLVPPDMDTDVAEGWIQNPKSFRRIVGEAIRKAACPPADFDDFDRMCDEAGAQADREIAALDAEAKLDAQIDEMAKKAAGFPVTYDQSLGLAELIKCALGPNNVDNFNRDITPERFSLKGTDVRTINVRVEPFLDGETGEQAAERLIAAGHVLANTGDLAGFLLIHPKEVEKWNWVVALSEDSRWTSPDGNVDVPYANVNGAVRYFGLGLFRVDFDSDDGVLVLCE